MEYSIYIGLLLVVAVCVWIYVKSKNKAGQSKAGTGTAKNKVRARADSIKKSEKPAISWGYVLRTPPDPGLTCPQAQKMREKPMPVDSLAQLPKLPLEGCNQRICRCQYQAMLERRVTLDRRESEERRSSIRFEDKADRRSHRDRRKFWKDDRSKH